LAGEETWDRKTNLISIIYSHSSTNPDNFAKIGPVDVEIIGLTEIVKNKIYKQQQNISPQQPVDSGARTKGGGTWEG